MNSNPRPINPPDPNQSPCIGVCTVGSNGLCVGCFRSMEEISTWIQMSEQQRKEILEQLPSRLEAMFA